MYYEEKMIDNVLHWRNSPEGEWQRCDIQDVSVRYEEAKEAYNAYKTCKTVQDLITHWLRDNGANGIYCDSGGGPCGCGIDDLCPCEPASILDGVPAEAVTATENSEYHDVGDTVYRPLV